MPRHLTQQEKWQLFLKTVSQIDSLTVTAVTNTEVSIKVENFEAFQARLGDSRQLQSQLIHSLEKLVGNGLECNNSNSSSSSSGSTSIPDLHRLTYIGFLTKLGLQGDQFPDLQHFQDNHQVRIANYAYRGSPSEVLSKIAEFTRLQEILRSQEHLLNVLNGSARLEHHDEDDPTPFAEDIIKITTANRHEVTVSFNYGKILQYAQAHSPSINPPIIVSEPDNIYTFDKDYLLKYLEKHLGGLVFHSEDSGQQIPIMFAPRQTLPDASNATHEFKILMDVSGSMAERLNDYKVQFSNIVRAIGGKVSNWNITIITFNNTCKTHHFSSSINTIEEILQYIDNLNASGQTDLYGAMKNALQSFQANFTSTPHAPSTLIVFTDGADTQKEYTEEAITSSARQLSLHNPQFAMYCCGLREGSYNPTFFQNIGSGIGFTTIDLSNLAQMETFKQYLDVVNNAREVWEFITSDSLTHLEHVPTGDISVGSIPVDISSVQIRHGANIVQVDTEVIEESVAHPAVDPAITTTLVEAEHHSQPLLLGSRDEQHAQDSSVSNHPALEIIPSAYDVDIVGNNTDWLPNICIIQ